MSFRFRRRRKILPGLLLNLSKSGVSLSVGAKGAGTVVSEWGSWLARDPNGGQPFDASGAGIFEIDFETSGRRSVHGSHLMPIEFASRF